MVKKTAAQRTKTTTVKRKSTKKATTRKKSTKPTRSTAKKRTATKSTKKRTTARKYSPAAGKEVEKEMRKFKKGTAKSGKAETPVESREQAIAIGLSKARAKVKKFQKNVSKFYIKKGG